LGGIKSYLDFSYLRDIIYRNAEITKLFNEDTIHVLDYDCEYTKGYPDAEKFPEFNNRVNYYL